MNATRDDAVEAAPSISSRTLVTVNRAGRTDCSLDSPPRRPEKQKALPKEGSLVVANCDHPETVASLADEVRGRSEGRPAGRGR
jgi:hypothetical protein